MEHSAKHTANHRSEWARQKYEEIIASWNITKSGTVIDQISGFKARKLDQAYRIYKHYLFIFNGSVPRSTSAYARIDKRIKIRERKNKSK